MEGAVIFLTGQGVEGLPGDVALMSGGMNVKVVKPVKNGGPGGCKGLGEGCCDECRVGLGAASWVTTCHACLQIA